MRTHSARFMRSSLSTIVLLSAFLAVLWYPAQAQVSVLTQHGDNLRTGENTQETILNPTNVASNFGKLFTLSLDANVNGQVLYVPNLGIDGGIHNVIFAYTSNNSNGSSCSLYAWDADGQSNTTPLWHLKFTNAAEWTTCTPVIDTANDLIYVVTKDNNDSGNTWLHAVNLLTGTEGTGSPVEIAASVPGTGDGNVNGVVTFNSAQANCRPGLLLLNGDVYLGFAHNSDSFPYHGWIFGYSYNGTAFTQTSVFCDNPNGGLDGIWQAGNGLAADSSGNIYVATANGTFNANTGGTEYGMCILRLTTPTLTVADYFAPFDELNRSNGDADLGGAGVIGIPGTDRLFQGGTKFGSAFLVDSTNLGKFTSGGPDNVLDRINSLPSNVGQNPADWDTGTFKYVYLWGNGAGIQEYRYDPSVSTFNPLGIYKQGSDGSGGSMTISSDGASNGILWTVGNNAVVHAINANDVTQADYWNSNTNSSRDGLGSVGHFQFPTVVNGKVYVATGSHSIVVYGLLTTPGPATHFTVSAPATATAGTAFNYTVTALDVNNLTATGYTGTIQFTSSDTKAVLPGNATLTNGVGTFSATLKTPGSQTLTATDTVTPSITGVSSGISVSPGAATHLSVSAPSTVTSGTATSVTVTALDAFGNTATGYSGTVHFTSTDSSASLPANSTLTSGVKVFSLTLKTSGSQTVTATDTTTSSITGTSGTISVSAGTATHFVVSAPGTATSGTPISVSVTAEDAANNTAAGYTGTVHFTSTDSSASLPANATLTNGVGTFSATLKTSGSQTVTATDTTTSSITGTSGAILVSAGAATHFVVSAPGTATSGTPISVSVTAEDAANNTAVAYTGIVHFTSTDSSASLPANAALTNGVGTFSATLNTAGSQTITATDTVNSSITGTSGAITVSTTGATHFVLSAPSTINAGSTFTLTVTAENSSGKVVTSYAGTVHFTTSDSQGSVPANSSLTNGTKSFNVALRTAGDQTITAIDTVTPSITGSSTTDVSPFHTSKFSIAAPATATAGTALNFTITAEDSFGNTTPAYAGTIQFTSTDAAAVLPGSSTLAGGVGTFPATFNTDGSQSITGTDTVSTSIKGTSNSIKVTGTSGTHFVVSAPTGATAGTAFTFTVTAETSGGATVTNYSGTVHFTSTDGVATLPANSTLTSGVGTFTATLHTSGNQTITATDTVTPTITGTSNTIVVGSTGATHLVLTAPSTIVAGSTFTLTVTAKDASGNTVPSYSGTMEFATSDHQGSVPAASTLTNGVKSFSIAFRTAGVQTVTATDTINSSITGTSTTTVSPFNTSKFLISAPSTATAGTPFDFSITAEDAFGNTTPAYAGTVHFTSTDGSASLPANSTLSSGTGTFSATLQTAGKQTIKGTDTVTTSKTGTSNSITVSP